MIETFTIRSRDHQMVCIMEYKNEESKGENMLLFNHGFVGNKITPHRMMVNLSRDLVKENITVVRFDFVGSGDSEGNYEYMTIPGEVEDSINVIEYLRGNYDIKNLMLLGYSMGGCIASLSAAKTNPDGLVLWSPVSNPYDNFKHLLGTELFEKGESGENVDFLGDMVGYKFFENLKDIDPIKELTSFENPIFIIHGEKDEDVLPENAKSYLSATDNTNIYFVEEASHTYDTYDLQLELIKKTKEYVLRILN